MEFISTLAAPTARGHYSQAVVHGGMVYVAGQLPIVPGDPDARRNPAESDYLRCFETSFVISNIETCLLPPKTSRSLSSALIMRRFVLS